MNKSILIGRLTADPEIKNGGTNSAVAHYRLAVDRQYKKEGQPDADFIPCVAFGKSADFAGKYLHKGMKIAVEGRIQTGSYEKDGVKHYTTDIIVERQEFCESKAQSGYTSPQNAPVDDYAEITDEDSTLPF